MTTIPTSEIVKGTERTRKARQENWRKRSARSGRVEEENEKGNTSKMEKGTGKNHKEDNAGKSAAR
jgi:hypothetical protein